MQLGGKCLPSMHKTRGCFPSIGECREGEWGGKGDLALPLALRSGIDSVVLALGVVFVVMPSFIWLITGE